MKTSTALTVILPEQKPEQIEAILLAFTGMEEIHSRLALLMQAGQGACLLKLKEDHGHHNVNRHSTACGVGWESFIKTKFGFSDEKARRLMQIWKAMLPLIEKLPPKDKQRLGDFLHRPMLHLTPEEARTLETITHKITDAETQTAFLAERGYLKKPHGHSLKNRPHGHIPSGDTPPPVTTDERIQIQLDLFGSYSLSLDDTVEEHGTKILLITKWPKPRLEEALRIAKRNVQLLVKAMGAAK